STCRSFPVMGSTSQSLDGGFGLASQLHLKKCVVSARRAQDGAHLLGVHRQRNRTAFAAVQNRRNLPGLAQPPRLVLPPAATGGSLDYHAFCTLCHGP